MIYSDGNEAMIGDEVSIAEKYRGVVVCCIDRGEGTPRYPAKDWAYFGSEVMIDTDFAGLVHYTAETIESEYITLIRRATSGGGAAT